MQVGLDALEVASGDLSVRKSCLVVLNYKGEIYQCSEL